MNIHGRNYDVDDDRKMGCDKSSNLLRDFQEQIPDSLFGIVDGGRRSYMRLPLEEEATLESLADFNL